MLTEKWIYKCTWCGREKILEPLQFCIRCKCGGSYLLDSVRNGFTSNGFTSRRINNYHGNINNPGGGYGSSSALYIIQPAIKPKETNEKGVYLSKHNLQIIMLSLKFSLDSARRIRDISQGKEKSPINQRICELKRLIKYLNEN